MADYPFYATGANYHCSLCNAVLPDGVPVFGLTDGMGNLIGVRAEHDDGSIVHECGTAIQGSTGTNADRLALWDDPSFLSEVQSSG